MALTLMYITNDPAVALIAEKNGVDRIWVDLETLGKEQRQKGLNSVKSHHTIEDIRVISPLLTKAEMLVRVNPINPESKKEIDEVIAAGADIIMLPMWKSPKEVLQFLKIVNGTIIDTIQQRTPERKWNKRSVWYILTNEKYVGDILWQKKFTPSVLPLRQKNNKGEMPKYLCSDAHQAIVSREEFSIVKRLMSERKEKFYSQKRSEQGVYYGKIKCRTCGWTYRLKKTKTYIEWVCGKTRKGLGVCPTHRYSEAALNATFVRVYNILKANRKILIDETILQLQTLKLKTNGGNTAISQIDEKIATLSRQNSLYSEMYANNIIDEVSYREKTDVLKRQIAEERERRVQIINGDENEYCLEEIRSLKREIENGPDKMTEFNPILFNFLKVIYAEENGSLSFVLKGDLTFTVRTEDIYE